MKNWILLALLVSAVVSVETVTNVIDPTPRHSSKVPIYEVGQLKANDLIRVLVNFPETPTTTNSKYQVLVLDSSKNPLNPQPGTFGVSTDAPVSPQSIAFEGRVPSNGLYYIQVEKISGSILHVIEITISVNGVIVQQVADMLRDTVLRLIYLISASTITSTSTIGCFLIFKTSPSNRMEIGTVADGGIGSLNSDL